MAAMAAALRSVALIASLLGVLACDDANPVGPTVPLGESFVLAPGETASIQGASINVRFVSVLSDSRCPSDAFCIQAGDAVVHISVGSIGGGLKEYDLHTVNMQPVTHDVFSISLVQLSPSPLTTSTIKPGEYRATFRVTR
jgi:hypothetical protein